MNKRKLLAVVVTVLAILMIIPFAASAEDPVKHGWYTDKGYYEYFDYGNQYKDGEYWINEYESYFRFDEAGKMLSAEWYRDPETLEYYYYQAGGYKAADCVLSIDGAYYGFDWNGVMYDNCEFEIYSEAQDKWVYYNANAGGTLKTNQWVWFEDADYHDGGYWKYYGADGVRYSDGIAKVGDSYYYFYNSGTILNNSYTDFYNDELGKWQYIRAKVGGALYCNEWYKDQNDRWYFYTDTCIAASGYTYVGSTPYVFYPDGEMVEDTVYYDYDNTGCSYLADKNGLATPLNPSGWTNVGNDFYYCVDGQVIREQIQLINGSYYYFNWKGIMLDDESIYFYDYEASRDMDIRAKAGGALYCGEWYQTPEGDFKYYEYDCSEVENGFITIGENQYYFEYGYAVKDRIIETGSAVYKADSNYVVTIQPEGWVNVDGDFYYVSNDQLVRDRMMEIGGATYYLNDEGLMLENWYQYTYDEKSDIYGYFLFGENGARIETPGWIVFEGDWYYMYNNFTLAKGYVTINGAEYYFYPSMNYGDIDYYYSDDGCYLYAVAPNGAYVKITADGYYSTLYGKVLVENGKLFSGWKEVNGKFYYYGFRMYSGGLYDIDDAIYYFDDSGAMQTGWILDGTNYLYADEYGRLVDGIVWVGNNFYMFNDYRLAYDSYCYANGGIYVSDANGVATLLESGDGWKQVNGYWYYVSYGDLAYGSEYIYENGEEVCYYFDYSTHRMLTDAYYDGCYIDEYGRRYEGWKQIDGAWAYFDPYRCWDGIRHIDNNRYCFNNGIMLANTTYFADWNDTIYVVDAYGIVVNEYEVPDGIIYQDGNAYLYQNGEAYNGWYGENYFEYGRMAIGEFITDNSVQYYIDAHGKYIRGGWYQYYDGDWIYANASGALCRNEWLQLGNAWYYFDGVWMCADGVRYIESEDKYGEFDKYGRFIGYVDDALNIPQGTANTWAYQDGKWYYYNSTGSMVRARTLYLGNAWYTFDFDGAMVSNCFYSSWDGNFRYYTASGAMLEACCEWKLIDGKWYYFDSNNYLVRGWFTIGNTRYYIKNNSQWDQATDTDIYDFDLLTGYHLINRKVYHFDASGACTGEYIGNGWLQLANGDFVYFKNGELLRDGVYNIGGTDYCFYYDGVLVTNDYYLVESIDRFIFASETGALYGAGWHNTSKGWIYVDASGEAYAYGVHNINGNVYFFEDGYWIP